MLKYRWGPGLGAFGAAGACVLGALYWSPMWIMTCALVYGAAAFTWLGLRIVLGKIRPAQRQVPPPSAPAGSFPPVHPRYPEQPRPHGTVADPSPPAAFPGVTPADGIPYRAEGPQIRSEQDALREAVSDSAKRIIGGIRCVVIVLSLVVLVPTTLLVAAVAVAMFLKGEALKGLMASAVVVFIVWYCTRRLFGTWERDTLIGGDDDG